MFEANQTKGFKVYLEGEGLIGVATIKLPTIKFMSEKLSGAGILGEIEVPLHGVTESMEVEIKFRSVVSDMFKLLDISGKTLEFYGSVQGLDGASGGFDEQQVHVTLKGSPKEADLGTIENNKLMDSSFKIECITLIVAVDGKEQFKFDKLNNIFMQLGKDLLAKYRSNLGLG